MSMGGMSDGYRQHSPGMAPYGNPRQYSQDSLANALRSAPLYQQDQRARSPLNPEYMGGVYSRPASTNNINTLAGFQTQGPSNDSITQAIRECLNEVDMDTVTKKQVKALVEQTLQCQLGAEKRAFLDAQIDLELANM